MRAKWGRFGLFISITMFLTLALAVGVLSAATAEGLTFTADCTGFTARGGALVTARDNTGRAREAIVIMATDAAGRVLYENVTIFPINQRINFEDGTRYAFTSAPEYNPIVIQVISQSGNNQPRQLVYLVTGACPGLPTIIDSAFIIGDTLSVLPPHRLEPFAPADGRAAPPIPLNTAPPRPVNPPGLAESQPGYAIVNTDNLFLRSGDGVQYDPVAVLDGGTRLIVLGSNGRFGDPDRLWWYVEVGDLRGWVKSEFLILRGDLRGLPVVPVTGTITQPALFVPLNNPLYNTPSYGGRILCEIQGGVAYPAVGINEPGASWFQIEAMCGETPVLGWLPGDRGLIRNPAGLALPIVR